MVTRKQAAKMAKKNEKALKKGRAVAEKERHDRDRATSWRMLHPEIPLDVDRLSKSDLKRLNKTHSFTKGPFPAPPRTVAPISASNPSDKKDADSAPALSVSVSALLGPAPQTSGKSTKAEKKAALEYKRKARAIEWKQKHPGIIGVPDQLSHGDVTKLNKQYGFGG